jgi:hypothetical protein
MARWVTAVGFRPAAVTHATSTRQVKALTADGDPVDRTSRPL